VPCEASLPAAAIAAAVCAQGFVVQDHYADAALVQGLAACAQLRWDRGEFAAARIGPAGAAKRHDELRGDRICWLAEPLLPAEAQLLRAFEELRLALNREAMLGLFDLEAHYARYDPGAGYARHVDQPQGRDQRRVSLVLYLNSDWQPELGGHLRIYDGARAIREIAPTGGRLVCFLSRGLEHEVLPSLRARLSLTGWFRTRA
jgi:SM-20-related protein